MLLEISRRKTNWGRWNNASVGWGSPAPCGYLGQTGDPREWVPCGTCEQWIRKRRGQSRGRTLLQLVRADGERTQAAFWPGERAWSCLDIRSSRRKHTEWVLLQCPAPRDLDSLRALALAHSPHTRDPGHLFAPLTHSHTQLLLRRSPLLQCWP